MLDAAVAGLSGDGHLTTAEGRLALSESGLAAAAKALGTPKLPQRWSDIRDTWLVAAALGLDGNAQPQGGFVIGIGEEANERCFVVVVREIGQSP